ncbi:hypothetical protein HK097_004760, partial [Rhizophlyctis rosea]
LLATLDPATRKAVLRPKASTTSLLKPRASSSILAMKRSQSALGFAKPALPSTLRKTSPPPPSSQPSDDIIMTDVIEPPKNTFRTPIKLASVRNHPVVSGKRSEESTEWDSLKRLLCSEDVEERVRGVGILGAVLRDGNGSGGDGVGRVVKGEIERLLEGEVEEEVVGSLLDTGVLRGLIECGVLEVGRVMDFLVGGLGRRVQGRGMRQVLEGVVEEVGRVIGGGEGMAEYFAGEASLKSWLFALVPLMNGAVSPTLESRLATILQSIYRYNADSFVRNLESGELPGMERVMDIVGVTRGPMPGGIGGVFIPGKGEGETLDGLSRIEGGEGATMMEFTFEQNSLYQLEGRAVCDETLPDGFADISIRSTTFHNATQEDMDVPAVTSRSIPRTPPPLPSAQRTLGELRERASGGMVSHAEFGVSSSGGGGGEDKNGRGLVRWKRDAHAVLFSAKTPTPHRPTKSEGTKELPKLLGLISAGVASNSTMRKLIRLSTAFTVGEGAESVSGAGDLWDAWFGETVEVVLGVLRRVGGDKELQETCLLLLKTMMVHQTRYFGYREKEVLQVLLSCRSDASGMVSGSAEDALETAVEMLDLYACFEAVVELLQEWDLSDFGRGNEEWVLPRGGGGRAGGMGSQQQRMRPGEFQPCPAASGFQFLGRVVGRVGKDGLEGWGVERVVGVAVQGLSSRIPEIRKSSTFCLVDVYACGVDVWRYLGSRLSDPQQKLLAVFIGRHRGGVGAAPSGGMGGARGGMAGM